MPSIIQMSNHTGSAFYLGYFTSSYFNKGIMLIDYVYLLVPLSVIWLSTLANGMYKIIFVPVVLFIIFQNMGYANTYIQLGTQNFIGNAGLIFKVG